MSRRFPHRLTITRPSTRQGTPDLAEGTFTPGGAATVVYDDRADVQDTGEARPRGASGMPELQSEASAFLANEAALFEIVPGDTAVVTYPNGRTADADVQFVRALDAVVLLRFR